MNKIILYGSYGYTGSLIAEMAAESEMHVLLSGRNAEKLQVQSEKLGLPHAKASLDMPDELDALMNAGDVVLHCAGPYLHTWRAMAEACLRNRCHYLDITGEIDVFESLKKLDEIFKSRGIMAMPGVGFDVVPTDCLALYLSKKIDNPTHLELAFVGLSGGISRGTTKTMIENMGEGGAVRKNGEIVSVPAAHRVKEVHFGNIKKRAVSIPWGDVSTAYTTTGIDNIIVYAALPGNVIRSMKWSRWLAPILRTGFVKKRMMKKADERAPGPGETARKKGRSLVWGQVKNESGEQAGALINTKEAYQLTAEMAFQISGMVLDGKYEPGYKTPAGFFGHELIMKIEGTEMSDMS